MDPTRSSSLGGSAMTRRTRSDSLTSPTGLTVLLSPVSKSNNALWAVFENFASTVYFPSEAVPRTSSFPCVKVRVT